MCVCAQLHVTVTGTQHCAAKAWSAQLHGHRIKHSAVLSERASPVPSKRSTLYTWLAFCAAGVGAGTIFSLLFCFWYLRPFCELAGLLAGDCLRCGVGSGWLNTQPIVGNGGLFQLLYALLLLAATRAPS